MNYKKWSYEEWLKDQVSINERRIRRIEENPDPVKLKSNKMIYQAERDLRLSELVALREGKPWISYPGAGMGDLFRAMGFEFSGAGGLNEKSSNELLRQSRDAYSAAGYPEQVCDLAVCSTAWTVLGIYPKMSCFIHCNATCQPMADSTTAVGLSHGAPIFNLTAPMDPHSDEDIAYVTEQLRDLIPWVEKNVPGAHYSEERLKEWLDAEERLFKNYHRIWETRKHKPCPQTARDSFREEMPAYMHPNKEDVVEWSRLWAEEMEERIATGTHLPKERIRLAWTNTGPIYDHDLFPWLEEQGVTIPAFIWPGLDNLFSISPECDLIAEAKEKKLSPLEQVAQIMCLCSINGLGDRLMHNYIETARAQDVDGFVFYANRGCVQQQGVMGLVAQQVREQLGIPFLVIKGTQVDERGYDKADTMLRLGAFLELVLASKARRGQHASASTKKSNVKA